MNQEQPTPIEELPVPREKACESCYPHRHGGSLQWCPHVGVYFCEPCIRHATAGCRVCTGLETEGGAS